MRLRALVHRFESRVIAEAMRDHHGNVSRTARALGMARSALIYKMRTLRLADAETPDDGGDDAPLAWVVRLVSERAELGAVWTPEEIAAEAGLASTVAFVLDEGAARALVRDVNTAIATRRRWRVDEPTGQMQTV